MSTDKQNTGADSHPTIVVDHDLSQQSACHSPSLPVDDVRTQLERWARSGSLPHRLVVRSRFLLRLLDGVPVASVAREFGVSRETVRRWRARLTEAGPTVLLHDRPGRGRRPGRAEGVVRAVVEIATQHPSWTLRQIARHAGTSVATAQRICREQGRGRMRSLDGQLVERDGPATAPSTGKAIATPTAVHRSHAHEESVAMSSLRHLLFALLLVIVSGPAAWAAPIVVGQVSVFDDTSFGPSVTVFNDTDLVPAFVPGQDFTDLSVELFDTAGSALATYSLDALAAGGGGWTPTAMGRLPAYGVVGRIRVALTFRRQSITAVLQSCAPDDPGDGCLSEILVPLTDGVDCALTPGECEVMRSGGAVLVYESPGTPVPDPAALSLLTSVAFVVARHRRRRAPR